MLVFDASTLILLAKAELLDLFLDDFTGVPLIPEAVEAECTSDPIRPDGLLIRERIRESRLRVGRIAEPETLARLLLDFRLGLGESEALVLALETGGETVVATDDRNAIRACKVLRIGFVTSLGILGRAVEKGLLDPQQGLWYLEKLRSLGRFRDDVIREVARQLGRQEP